MIQAAVIGAGYIAREHLDCLRSLPGVATAGLCDLSGVMAEATAAQFGVPRWFRDHREMLAAVQPDVVHVTTPVRSHATLATDALEAGAHVLVEKPLSLDPAECERLIGLAEQRERFLLEDHNYLFNDSVRRIRALIDDGRFGEVVHVEVLFAVDILGPRGRFADPNRPSPYAGVPGGAITDFLTHLAYLAHAFVGEHRSVHTSWGKRSDVDAVPYDEFRALVTAERGTASLAFSAHARPDQFWLRVHGTQMRATASLFEPLLTLERLRGGPRPLLPVANGLALAGAYTKSAFGGLVRKLAGRPITYDGLWHLLAELYESVGRGAGPPVVPETIRAVNGLVCEMLDQEGKT